VRLVFFFSSKGIFILSSLPALPASFAKNGEKSVEVEVKANFLPPRVCNWGNDDAEMMIALG